MSAAAPIVYPSTVTLSVTAASVTLYGRGFDTEISENTVELFGFNLTEAAASQPQGPFSCNSSSTSLSASVASVMASDRHSLSVSIQDLTAQQAVRQSGTVQSLGACAESVVTPLSVEVVTSNMRSDVVNVNSDWDTFDVITIQQSTQEVSSDATSLTINGNGFSSLPFSMYVYEVVTDGRGSQFPDFTETGSCNTSSLCVFVQAKGLRSSTTLTLDITDAFDASDAGNLYVRLLIRTACFQLPCLMDQYYPINVVTNTQMCARASDSTGLQEVFPQLEQCHELSELVQVATLVPAAPIVQASTATVFTSDSTFSICATGITTSSSGDLALYQNCNANNPAVSTCTSVRSYSITGNDISTSTSSCLIVTVTVATTESLATVGKLFATLSVAGKTSNVTQVAFVDQATPVVFKNLATISTQGQQLGFSIQGSGFDSVNMSANKVFFVAEVGTDTSITDVVVTSATSTELIVDFTASWLSQGSLEVLVETNGVSSAAYEIIGFLGDVAPVINPSSTAVYVSTTSILLTGYNLGSSPTTARFEFSTAASSRVVQGLTQFVNSTFAIVEFTACVPSISNEKEFGTESCNDLSLDLISSANRVGQGFQTLFASLTVFDTALNLLIDDKKSQVAVGQLVAESCLPSNQAGHVDLNYCSWSTSSYAITLLGDGFMDHSIEQLSVEFFPENGSPVYGNVSTLTHCTWVKVSFKQISASNHGVLSVRITSSGTSSFSSAVMPVATLVRGKIAIDVSNTTIVLNQSEVSLSGFGFDIDSPQANVIVFTADNANTRFPVTGVCSNATQQGLVHFVSVTFTELGPYNAGGLLYVQAYSDAELDLYAPVLVGSIELGHVYVAASPNTLLSEAVIGSTQYNVSISGRGFAPLANSQNFITNDVGLCFVTIFRDNNAVANDTIVDCVAYGAIDEALLWTETGAGDGSGGFSLLAASSQIMTVFVDGATANFTTSSLAVVYVYAQIGMLRLIHLISLA